MSKVDINDAVRMVDNWRERCPGKVEQRKLIKIGIQKERRLLRRLVKKVKHIIYLQDGTQNIWYKNSDCDVGVVKMGFSLKRLAMHPNAVPMEFYYAAFMEPDNPLPIDLLRGQDLNTLREVSMSAREWLRINDYVLIG